jgi:hypothetical protein
VCSSDDGDDVLATIVSLALPERPTLPPQLDPGHVLGGESDDNKMIDDILADSDRSVESVNHETLDNFRRRRLRRCRDTLHYSGNVKRTIQQDHFDKSAAQPPAPQTTFPLPS